MNNTFRKMVIVALLTVVISLNVACSPMDAIQSNAQGTTMNASLTSPDNSTFSLFTYIRDNMLNGGK